MLYIHIPFCDAKCGYCSFNSFTDKTLEKSYFKALQTQLEFDLELLKPSTLYIGGGTPSSVGVKNYEKIFKTIYKYAKPEEVTVEVNPKSADKTWLKEIKGFGVNRLSIGIQSFNQEKLELLTRIHTKDEGKRAFYDAREAGFENISIDIIYDTALDSKKMLEEETGGIRELNPEHLSAYSLIIEDESAFRGKIEKKRNSESLQKDYVEEFSKLLPQYEISNYGLPSKHNRGYWEYKEYLGVGAGAAARVGKSRYYPKKELNEYIKDPLFREEEKLTDEDIKCEKIFLGLRSDCGFPLGVLDEKELKRVKILEEENKIKIKDLKVYNYNYFIADELALYIMD